MCYLYRCVVKYVFVDVDLNSMYLFVYNYIGYRCVLFVDV